MQSEQSFSNPWVGVIALALFLLAVVSVWRIFQKAGRPGWAVLVPVYNVYVLCKILGWSGWFVLLWILPLVNFFLGIVAAFKLASAFQKGPGFAVGLLLLPMVFYPILAFGDAVYAPPTPAAA